MASIKERIHFFTEKMTLKFALGRIGQISQLSGEVHRYLLKEIHSKSKMPLQFNSQDLRALTVQLEKVHKQANRQIDCMKTRERLFKRAEELKPQILAEKDPAKLVKLKRKAYDDETQYLCSYIALARDLQALVSSFNYYALDTYLLEQILAKEKEIAKSNDDKILQDELEFIMFDLMSNNF